MLVVIPIEVESLVECTIMFDIKIYYNVLTLISCQ